jgi:hypothetical protein
MSKIPYRHVDLSIEVEGKRLKALDTALADHETQSAIVIAGEIANDLRGCGDEGLVADAPEAVAVAKALEAVVRTIAGNRRALLPLRKRFPRLSRVIKDPWSTERVEPAVAELVATLAKRQRTSVRVDPELNCKIDTDGVLGRADLVDDILVFSYRRRPVARVEGPRQKLMLLGELIGDDHRLTPDRLLAIEVPKDIAAFRESVEAGETEVAALLAEGRNLVEAAERLVCALYAIPTEMEDEVVAHAVSRAEAAAATHE